MGSGVLAEILEWSSKQPAWQRDALRRLFTTAALSAADLDDLVALCKAHHGLSQPQVPRVLETAHLAIKDGDAATVSLISVTHHRGINALAPEQTVVFGPNLTIVYGQNAAGKSGYTRILKRGCRSRFAEDILGNVLGEGAPLKGQATIRYRAGEGQQAGAWTTDSAPTGLLASVSVFDGQCAPVYLREKTDVAFRPFSLDVFDKLSGVCSEVKKRLDSERLALNAVVASLPRAPEGTKVAALLSSLTSLTQPDAVRALAALSEKDEARIKALRDQQRDFLASDPKKKAQELDLQAARFDLVASHAKGLFAVLGSAGLDVLRASAGVVAAAQAALAQLRKTVMTPDLLDGTGEEAWRAMWDAAGEFSATAYPKNAFPAVFEGAKCVLCQQPIGTAAAARFKHFRHLVTSTAQAEVRIAEAAHAKSLEAVRKATIDRDDISLALDELGAHDAELARRVRAFLEEAALVRRAVADGQTLPSSGVPVSPEAELRASSKGLHDRATQLRKQAPQMDAKDAAELKELEARAVLKEYLQAVLEEIERKTRIAAYGLSVEDTSTAQITRKSTELTKRLVTERLRDGFQEELKRLDFTHLAVELKTAGGAKGALFHQLVFTNAPGVVVAKVLSEGESRSLSLAAFLAELSTAPTRSGIIFDDPVSSLDHIWRERIARRLVLEAKTRQVIVFTHDILFLKLLLDEAGHQDVPYQHQYLRRDNESSGICSPSLPWVAMKVKDRIGVLRARWQESEKISRTAGADAYEREARDVYGMLREAWEQGVGEVLLFDVIERYRPSIETKKVRYLHDITEDDCAAVDAAMTECSRWMRGHDQPPADGTPFPKPAELQKRIEELDGWCQRIRKRRDGKKSQAG